MTSFRVVPQMSGRARNRKVYKTMASRHTAIAWRAIVGVALGIAVMLPTATAGAAPLDAPIDTPEQSEQAWAGSASNPYGGQDYYVDSQQGDDANAGTDVSAPWKTLGKVNETVFRPGDRILLKAGSSWQNQQLWPKGSGVDGKPISIGAYGEATAHRPYIATNGNVESPFSEGIGTGNPVKNPDKVGTTGAIVLRNQQYWEISDVQLSNDDDFTVDKTNKDGTVWDGISISVNADLLEREGVNDPASTVMRHFRISNVYVHNLDSPSTWQKIYAAGVNFQVFGSKNHQEYERMAGGYRFDDISIENNVFDNVDLNAIQVGFNWFGDGTGETDANGKWHDGWEHLWVRTHNQYTTNVAIRHNYMHSIGQGAIQVGDVRNGVMEYNTVNGYLKRYDVQSCAIYAYASADIVMRYNEVFDGAATTWDGTPWDFEYNDFNVIYEHNYSHDNGAGWFAYMGNTDKAIARYNLSVNDNGTMIREFMSSNYSPTWFTNNVIVYDGGSTGSGNTKSAFHNDSFKDTLYFVNNVFYNTNTNSATRWHDPKNGSESAKDISKAIFRNNVFYEASGKRGEGEPENINGITDEPRFQGFAGDSSVLTGLVNKTDPEASITSAAKLFTPSNDSPLLNAGLYNEAMGQKDILGGDVFHGLAPEIGIVERTDIGGKNTNPVEENIKPVQGNLALGKTVIAGSTHPNGKFPASNITDGKVGTRWAAADGPDYPVTLDIDFGKTVTVNRLDITEFTEVSSDPGNHPEWATHHRVQRYSLWRWDEESSDWVKFHDSDQGLPDDTTSVTFADQTTSKIRLQIDAVYDNVDMYQGKPGSPTVSEIAAYRTASPQSLKLVASLPRDGYNLAQNAGVDTNQVSWLVSGDHLAESMLRIMQPNGNEGPLLRRDTDYTVREENNGQWRVSLAEPLVRSLPVNYPKGMNGQSGAYGFRLTSDSGSTLDLTLKIINTPVGSMKPGGGETPNPGGNGTTTPGEGSGSPGAIAWRSQT